ncbi:prephenate dehydrogenase/arogenate dehydrogenase family protein [Egicoccus halophilus]|uniref:Prephenate dehydrogenase n=1 Tax=Egicoccus halophilus TaxID=1670830 RepID=A0A8J3A8Z3_9ACTN|nr:prephenate dehydrogenase/arogenate dehydrogenase family protein [Egicoccus halophilus]GGI04891.1 prephenate dehydrogenase [Egicoccus halophilus]
MSTTPRLAVLGGGLIGGSLAVACRRLAVGHVTLTDTSADVRRAAAGLGLADEVAEDVAACVRAADVVVAAVPAAVVGDVLEQAARYAPADAVFTDVASLKGSVTLEVTSRLRAAGVDPARFVGGHPMAGSERSGPQAADATLFQAATWVLTPTADTAAETLRRVSGVLRQIGARVLALAPARHDELVALVSHLPHLAACTLADVAGEASARAGEVVLAVAGGGFRDTTRIAASDPRLWRGILAGNRDAVLVALNRYEQRLTEVRRLLERGDDEALEALLGRAARARAQLVPKAVDDAVVDVVVALDDRPGALATITTALGEAAINVEDLAMRHAEGRRGALLVRIAAGECERALEVLTARGLAAHAEPADAAT